MSSVPVVCSVCHESIDSEDGLQQHRLTSCPGYDPGKRRRIHIKHQILLKGSISIPICADSRRFKNISLPIPVAQTSPGQSCLRPSSRSLRCPHHSLQRHPRGRSSTALSSSCGSLSRKSRTPKSPSSLPLRSVQYCRPPPFFFSWSRTMPHPNHNL